jgi:hypothetical protein
MVSSSENRCLALAEDIYSSNSSFEQLLKLLNIKGGVTGYIWMSYRTSQRFLWQACFQGSENEHWNVRGASVFASTRARYPSCNASNTGSLISFRVGAEDAGLLSKEFYPILSSEDLTNLPDYNMYLKPMVYGTPSRLFSATAFEIY